MVAWDVVDEFVSLAATARHAVDAPRLFLTGSHDLHTLVYLPSSVPTTLVAPTGRAPPTFSQCVVLEAGAERQSFPLFRGRFLPETLPVWSPQIPILGNTYGDTNLRHWDLRRGARGIGIYAVVRVPRV